MTYIFLSLLVTDSWYCLALHLLVTDSWYYTWSRLSFYSFLIADNTYDLHFSFSTRYWQLIPWPSLVLTRFWLSVTCILSFSLLTADRTLRFTCPYSFLTADTTYDLYFVLPYSLLTADTTLPFTCLLLIADTTHDRDYRSTLFW